MRIVFLPLAFLLAASLPAQDRPLSVIRHTPGDSASPGNIITVTFDRPVAGRLDATIEARRIVRIDPAIAGRIEWRDPVTIRFVPDAPLVPGDSFHVTVDTGFTAIDGSRLARPYRITVRIPGPQRLAASVRGGYDGNRDALPPDGRIELLYSAPVDLDWFARAKLVVAACNGLTERRIPMRVIRQRPVSVDDPWQFRVAGGWDRDTVGDQFRRVLELEPTEPLPNDCTGRIELPVTPNDPPTSTPAHLFVDTPRSFRLVPPSCDAHWRCAMDHITVAFTAPVKREDVLRHVHISPAVPVELAPGPRSAAQWRYALRLAPRATYRVTVSDSLRDIHGRPLLGPRRFEVATGDFRPAIGYASGSVTIPRSARTLPVRHVNVQRVRMISHQVPDDARSQVLVAPPFLQNAEWLRAAGRPDTTEVTLGGLFNVERTTEVPLPARLVSATSGLVVLRFEAVQSLPSPEAAAALRAGGIAPVVVSAQPADAARPVYLILQRTGLAVHAKAGSEGSEVLVTGLADGRARAGASVTQRNVEGIVLARGVTGSDGIAVLRRVERQETPRRTAAPVRGPARWSQVMEVEHEGDRTVMPLSTSPGDWLTGELRLSQLGGRGATPPVLAATLFADRGIYRPGEMLYLTGVLREGPVGALTVPVSTDSVRLRIRHRPPRTWGREDVVIRDTLLRMSAFGTVLDSVPLRPGLPLGDYFADLTHAGQSVAWAEVRVAEYRAPEFLVDATTDSIPRYGSDTARIDVAARYLFGAPMGRADVQWRAALHEVQPWELEIPGAEGWTVGEWSWNGFDAADGAPAREIAGAGTLDSMGRLAIAVPLDSLRPSRPGRADVHVAVTDINRQTVTSSASVPVHPARLYVLAKKRSRGWYWSAGEPAVVDIRAAQPDGTARSSVPVIVTLVSREWRWDEAVKWTDSVLRTDTVVTSRNPVPYTFTPAGSGMYELRLSAVDEHGAVARTTLSGYALAPGGGWWRGSPFHLPLVAERRELEAGDSATVLFDSPFDVAEAWITVEREGVLERRRRVVHRGANTVSLRITDAHVPNAFVSVVLVARTAGGAERPDSAAELFRAGYVEFRVKTDTKRLGVAVHPVTREHGPGDTATFRVRVTDHAGRGARSEVTLWAVDQGVLALTGFETPDILSQLYQPRAIGMQLGSTLTGMLAGAPSLHMSLGQRIQLRGAMGLALSEEVVTGVAEETGAVSPAGASMRRRFRSTAFYLARATTNVDGSIELHAKLPDNLTSYRVMAVAVGTADRFGSGDTTLLVTRPLVARPTLPRFVRASDSLLAGTVVNVRDGGERNAVVAVEADGIIIRGPASREMMLAAGTGREARFSFVVPHRDRAPDSVVVRIRASGGGMGDAVETRLPVRPDFHPRTHTGIGVIRGSTDFVMELPPGVDPERSRLTVRIGTSPLAPMLAAWDWFRVYPYHCTEQIASGGRALLAVWHATRHRDPNALGGDVRARLQALADELVRRQRGDGAIRFWGDHEWSTPWLTTYAGLFLLEAKQEGVVVDSATLDRIADHLESVVRAPVDTGATDATGLVRRRRVLAGRVAAVDLLRRMNRPAVDAEDRLVQMASRLSWEDRLRLAEVLAATDDARAHALLEAAWAGVTRAGRRVDLPAAAHDDREFPSRIAPAARLLTATIALQPDHPLLGGLVETVLQHGRAEGAWAWNTQDYASAVRALAALDAGDDGVHAVRVQHGGRTLLSRHVGASDSAASTALTGLLEHERDGTARLRLRLASETQRPVFFAVSVDEVPLAPPVTPDIKGIVVERWYERFDDGRPVTAVQEGDLVRVRLRVTVPADRQFVAVEDPLPAGLEVVDLSLNTSGTLQPFTTPVSEAARVRGEGSEAGPRWQAWLYGRWEDGWWSPWEHKALHDDRVVHFARMLWKGSYTASYVARATTAGSFVRAPAHAEEMYNPAVQGRSDGGRFAVEGMP